MAISISKFASDPNLLNLELWPKQAEILEEFWQGNYAIAIWALGRRSGKTLMSAVVATYAACMLSNEYKKHLRQDERFYIVSIANTIDQAKIALQNVKDLIKSSPILKPLIIRETTDTLELSNNAVFKALPASSRSGRGMACPLLIFDELAHAVDTDGGNSAGSSLYQALSPSVAQFGDSGKILMLSSPWLQSGIFWNLFKQASSGQFERMQVVNAPTWEINPTISRQWLEEEKRRDPELFAVEYGANFSHNLAAFIDPALVDMATNAYRDLLPSQPRFYGQYLCSVDPAKGSRDAYTCCIAHMDDERLVVDRFHEFRPSFENGRKTQVSVSQVEEWLQEHHQLYGFKLVCLDQYNSMATIQRLSNKMPIQELIWSAPNKTKAFSKLRQIFNSHQVELYPHQKAIQELKNLIVHYQSNGNWSVTGGSGAAVDDFAMALGGVVLLAEETSAHWLSCYSMR